MSDLISREQAISWIECWLGLHKYYHPYSKCKTMPTSAVLDILNRVPSAEKTGKWKRIDYADEANGYLIPNYECSQCGYWSIEDYDYCPNCGARMVNENE